MRLEKTHATTSMWQPLEEGAICVDAPAAVSVSVVDPRGRRYVDVAMPATRRVEFRARGAVGQHTVTAVDATGAVVATCQFTLRAQTTLSCNCGPYARLAERLAQLLQRNPEHQQWVIKGKRYKMYVCWGRDHVHTLKAMKYLDADVKSGLEYWLETQEPNGMLWDCIYPNPDQAPSWFGEALGPGYFRYDDGMKYIVRRIPVEADCEFLYTEGVWAVWKATGDDAWMAAQLPVLERALTYNSSDPTRWSAQHGLVRRSMCQDSWDFVNPHYCHGDHRCINPGDPQFLFHGDNSGLYASYWRLAEMHAALGHAARAAALRAEGEALRARANAALFFAPTYGHMIPETLPPAEVYALVGDERQRMSLSLGYTLNRGLPTHAMAVQILREYQRRGRAKLAESFAEWWTMDPPYTPAQWSGAGHSGCPAGEYMNGAICTIIAGEVAKAAFEHGEEAYGADILERAWQLSERDGGELFQAYRRLPDPPPAPPPAHWQHLDLRAAANRGLANGAHPGVVAWTGEGDNDLRALPVGAQTFASIPFVVLNPAANLGRSVVFVPASPASAPVATTIAVPGLLGRSVYFLHTTAAGSAPHAVVGTYDVGYADGVAERIYLRSGHEIGLWWGPSDAAMNRDVARVAWRGANPTWKNVGLYVYGWTNPRPAHAITGIRVVAAASANPRAGLFIAGISVSDQPVQFGQRIRSYGLPDSWAQAAVYYALVEGLAGITDDGRAFDCVRIAPHWAASRATEAAVTLHYPASDAYVAYRYHDDGHGQLILDVTGCFERAELHVLLPVGQQARRVTLGTQDLPFANATIESSAYVDFTVAGLTSAPVVIAYGR